MVIHITLRQVLLRRPTDVLRTSFYNVRKRTKCGPSVTQAGPKLTSNRRPTDVLNWTAILRRLTDIQRTSSHDVWKYGPNTDVRWTDCAHWAVVVLL